MCYSSNRYRDRSWVAKAGPRRAVDLKTGTFRGILRQRGLPGEDLAVRPMRYAYPFAAASIRARADAGLTQKALAERMGPRQEVVARREGGEVVPATRTRARPAKATGTRLQISFAPSHAVAK